MPYLRAFSLLLMISLGLTACGNSADESPSVEEMNDAALPNMPTDASAIDMTSLPDVMPTPQDMRLDVMAVDQGVVAADSGVDATQPVVTPRPDLPEGPADRVARVACALRDSAAMTLIAAAEPGGAGQILLLPSDQHAYDVELPDSGTGYVTLEVPDWAITIGGGLDVTQSLTIRDPEGVTEEILPLSWNGVCGEDGLTDQRLKYHSWGAFVAELSGEPGSTIRLSFVKL